MSAFSTLGTVWPDCVAEGLRLIFIPYGVEDDEETRDDEGPCESAKVLHKPRLLSDNGSSYIAGDLAEYLEDKGMKHVRGAPMHPQTQGCPSSNDLEQPR